MGKGIFVEIENNIFDIQEIAWINKSSSFKNTINIFFRGHNQCLSLEDAEYKIYEKLKKMLSSV